MSMDSECNWCGQNLSYEQSYNQALRRKELEEMFADPDVSKAIEAYEKRKKIPPIKRKDKNV